MPGYPIWHCTVVSNSLFVDSDEVEVLYHKYAHGQDGQGRIMHLEPPHIRNRLGEEVDDDLWQRMPDFIQVQLCTRCSLPQPLPYPHPPQSSIAHSLPPSYSEFTSSELGHRAAKRRAGGHWNLWLAGLEEDQPSQMPTTQPPTQQSNFIYLVVDWVSFRRIPHLYHHHHSASLRIYFTSFFLVDSLQILGIFGFFFRDSVRFI
mgnify:CR=1 FL=1